MNNEVKEKPSNYPRVYSRKFPDGFNQTEEQIFVPWSDFLLMQEAFESAKAFIDVHVGDPDITPEMVIAFGEYVDALKKLEEAKARK